MNLIDVKNLLFKYKMYSGEKEEVIEHTAIDNISLSIKKGDFVGILWHNGSGKSIILNIIANKLMLTGKEYATSNSFGIVDYCGKFSSECQFSYGEDEFGNAFRRFPENSRFIKSEDILYEIKKIQQRQILSDGMEYDYMKNGHSQKRSRFLVAFQSTDMLPSK